MDSLIKKPAIELSNLVRNKSLSPADLMEATLRRIEAVNPPLNAFVALRADEALDEAKALAENIAAGKDPGPLAGIPIGVKDMEDTRGMVTSFG